MARGLGYSNYAEYALENQMAKTPFKIILKRFRAINDARVQKRKAGLNRALQRHIS